MRAEARDTNRKVQPMAPRVLISDALSPAAVQIFKDRGVEVDFQPKLGADKEKLAELVGNFDGLAIRSATKVTPKILEQAKKLKVIGRDGDPRRSLDPQQLHADGISRSGGLLSPFLRLLSPFGGLLSPFGGASKHLVLMLAASNASALKNNRLLDIPKPLTIFRNCLAPPITCRTIRLETSLCSRIDST